MRFRHLFSRAVSIAALSLMVLLVVPVALHAQDSAQGPAEDCESCWNEGNPWGCDTFCGDNPIGYGVGCTAYPCLGQCSFAGPCSYGWISPDGSAVDRNDESDRVSQVQFASLGAAASHDRRNCDGAIVRRSYSSAAVVELRRAMHSIDLEG